MSNELLQIGKPILFQERILPIIFKRRNAAMFNRISFTSVIFFAILFVVSSANASVEGVWAADARIKVTVTMKGHTVSRSENGADVLTFSPDGSFSMTDATGTWREKKNKFTVWLDTSDIQTFFDSVLVDYGLNASVTVTKCIITGTEGKSTIRGAMTFKGVFFLINYGLHGTMTATANFAGARTTEGEAESAGFDASESLKAVIRELVLKSLSSPEQ
jgi:hypothetical protein